MEIVDIRIFIASKQNIYFQVFIIITLLSLWVIPVTYASASPSILLPRPQKLTNYKKNFSTLPYNNKWKVRIHGLRNVPLDPRMWGSRRAQRTDNRRLIPIKAYYLRVSEDPSFELEEIQFSFQFQKTKKRRMHSTPWENDPVLEIGFAGALVENSAAERPFRDTSYSLRLTAFPEFESGIYYRSHTKNILLKKGPSPLLETGKNYQVRLYFKKDSLFVDLDEKPYAAWQAPDLNRGLVYLKTSWHPIKMPELTVKGYVLKDEERRAVTLSGLAAIKKET